MDDQQENKTSAESEIQVVVKLSTPPLSLTSSTFGSITKLNLANCSLSSLPAALPEALPNLSILFAPNNSFEEMPAVLGACPKLQMVSFKQNAMKRIHPDALQPQLRWLILTDNALEALPSTIGRCRILQKLMLSGNKLEEIPDEISKCQNLELVRLASNRLVEPPLSLLRLKNLSWVALSANPFLSECYDDSTPVQSNMSILKDANLDDVSHGEILGTGASGITRQVNWNGTDVAVKHYYGTMTSDGNPAEERRIALVASSSSGSNALIKVLGQTPQGSLVMELLKNYSAFADPPSFESCSRDVYNSDDQTTPMMSAAQATAMVTSLLGSLSGLHAQGICHGDFYGHNILVSRDDRTKVKLSDFGAAWFYHKNTEYGNLVERTEMRSFSHLVNEIESLLKASEPKESSVCGVLKELVQAYGDQSQTFATLEQKWTVLAKHIQ